MLFSAIQAFPWSQIISLLQRKLRRYKRVTTELLQLNFRRLKAQKMVAWQQTL
jgi:hypothetical protein